jgi:hypothetical protein
VAADEGVALIAIGTLPTLRERDLSLSSMSPFKRYAALNEQVLRLRGGRPLTLDIAGIETLTATHSDVMLEAATTSFQVHLQTPVSEVARTYNASQLLAAPLGCAGRQFAISVRASALARNANTLVRAGGRLLPTGPSRA